MTIETKLGPKITLEIPLKYYGTLARLRHCVDIGRTPKLRPITEEWVYNCYRRTMESLINWLLDQTKDFGYRNGAFRVLGLSFLTLKLQQTDNPLDAFWTDNVICPITEKYGFDSYLDLWNNDP